MRAWFSYHQGALHVSVGPYHRLSKYSHLAYKIWIIFQGIFKEQEVLTLGVTHPFSLN